jgi:hypothetical protein
MSKKRSTKQKKYKMKGCSKTYKKHLGGSNLAYTGKMNEKQPNPFLAYTGNGGSSDTSNIRVNTNAEVPSYPNTGPEPRGDIFFNSIRQRGGSGCGCSQLCNAGIMVGGTKHRSLCKCIECKKNKKAMSGGNVGMTYPNGLVGQPIEISKVNGLPGENGIPGDRNYNSNNTYNTDISRQMVNLDANPPLLKGGKKKQKGGSFMPQELINLGRQFQFGVGSTYNALSGYKSPVNPLPWKDQLTNVNNRPNLDVYAGI